MEAAPLALVLGQLLVDDPDRRQQRSVIVHRIVLPEGFSSPSKNIIRRIDATNIRRLCDGCATDHASNSRTTFPLISRRSGHPLRCRLSRALSTCLLAFLTFRLVLCFPYTSWVTVFSSARRLSLDARN